MSGTPSRENAVYMFGHELNQVEVVDEGESERSPNRAILPTGFKANRAFIAGTLREAEYNEDSDYLRATLSDMSGHSDATDDATVFIGAGEWEPEAQQKLRNIEPPEFISVCGKVNTWENDEGEVYVNIRPETISTISPEERDRWTLDAVKKTVERVEAFQNGDAPAYDEAVDAYGEDVSDVLAVARDTLLEIAPDDVAPDLGIKELDIDVSAPADDAEESADDDAAEADDADDSESDTAEGDAPESIGREHAD